MSKMVTIINTILTYPTPFLIAKCAPVYDPITILTAIINPYVIFTWPRIINNVNAPTFEAKFSTFAFPAALKKSNPNINNTNNINDPVPPPKNPS